MLANIYLNINGQKITNWTKVSIKKSLFRLAHDFIFTFDGNEDLSEAIKGFEPVEIYYGNIRMLTGYIEFINPKLNNDGFFIDVIGSSKTIDLVDCSYLGKNITWKNADLLSIIVDLIKGFNINIFSNIDLGTPFKKFSHNLGDKIFDTMSRACAERSLIPLTNSGGDLSLTIVPDSFSIDSLIYQRNILQINLTNSYKDRFSQYIVRSQENETPSSGWNKKSISVKGEAFDSEILRYRPLQIISNNQMSNKLAKDKAAWESQVRAGKSMTLDITVKDWVQSNQSMWNINSLVPVIINKKNFAIRENLLISDTEYIYDNNGIFTKLSLVHQDTFKPEPKQQVKVKANNGWTL